MASFSDMPLPDRVEILVFKKATLLARNAITERATSALFERRDVIIVASVSCIYSLGPPEEYAAQVTALRPGMTLDRDELAAMWQVESRFTPAIDDAKREEMLAGWHKAVAMTTYQA